MTKRLVYLAALGLLVVVLAAIIMPGAELFVFAVYNLVLLALYVVDFFIAAKPDILKITRAEDEKLYFKTTNKIVLNVKNSHHSPINVTLKDEIADFHFKVSGSDMAKVVEAGQESIFSYTVTPTKRGAFIFHAFM